MSTSHITDKLKEILSQMGVTFTSIEVIESPKSNHTRYLIHTNEPAILIGTNGDHLNALNFILRRIIAKSVGEEVSAKFFIDVNGYHDKNVEHMKTKAKVMADRARTFKIDVELDPMTSYERMLIHSFLESEPEIKTESVGEGNKRRVVIKYIAPTSAKSDNFGL